MPPQKTIRMKQKTDFIRSSGQRKLRQFRFSYFALFIFAMNRRFSVVVDWCAGEGALPNGERMGDRMQCKSFTNAKLCNSIVILSVWVFFLFWESNVLRLVTFLTVFWQIDSHSLFAKCAELPATVTDNNNDNNRKCSLYALRHTILFVKLLIFCFHSCYDDFPSKSNCWLTHTIIES